VGILRIVLTVAPETPKTAKRQAKTKNKNICKMYAK
jgi:hypothetical protein